MEADVVIGASNKLVFPGGIDPHTHVELMFGGTGASDVFLRMQQRIIGSKTLSNCRIEKFVVGC